MLKQYGITGIACAGEYKKQYLLHVYGLNLIP